LRPLLPCSLFFRTFWPVLLGFVWRSLLSHFDTLSPFASLFPSTRVLFFLDFHLIGPFQKKEMKTSGPLHAVTFVLSFSFIQPAPFPPRGPSSSHGVDENEEARSSTGPASPFLFPNRACATCPADFKPLFLTASVSYELPLLFPPAKVLSSETFSPKSCREDPRRFEIPPEKALPASTFLSNFSTPFRPTPSNLMREPTEAIDALRPLFLHRSCSPPPCVFFRRNGHRRSLSSPDFFPPTFSLS